jgi:septal ring factor EnvC (AmiA/AmiB activator)
MNKKRWAALIAAIAAGGFFTVNKVTQTTNVTHADSTASNLVGYMITEEQLLALDSTLTEAFNEAVDDIPTPSDSLLYEILRRADEQDAKLDSIQSDLDSQEDAIDELSEQQRKQSDKFARIEQTVDELLASTPDVFIIEGDSITPADTTRLKWKWPPYRGWPKKVPVDD